MGSEEDRIKGSLENLVLTFLTADGTSVPGVLAKILSNQAVSADGGENKSEVISEEERKLRKDAVIMLSSCLVTGSIYFDFLREFRNYLEALPVENLGKFLNIMSAGLREAEMLEPEKAAVVRMIARDFQAFIKKVLRKRLICERCRSAIILLDNLEVVGGIVPGVKFPRHCPKCGAKYEF